MQEGEQGDFYYLHTNGSLIYKRFCPEKEPGGFVHHIWKLDKTDRSSAWRILTEAWAIGCDSARINVLAKLWGCDDDDAQEYCDRRAWHWSVDGDQYCVHGFDFENLAESHAGFGATLLEAIAEYIRPDIEQEVALL